MTTSKQWTKSKAVATAMLALALTAFVIVDEPSHDSDYLAGGQRFLQEDIIWNMNEPKEFPPQDASAVCDPRNFLVLIKAGAKSKYQERRKIWRNSSCPISYKDHSMKYHFMLAMPAHKLIDPNSHNQGARANDDEIHDMERLQHESLANNDMEFLPIKDVYEDSNLKVISMLRWAVDRGMNENTLMVVLHDDEYCLQPQVLQDMCVNATQSNSSLYAGWHLWKTPGYKIQKAFDGSFAPFFSGWLYALSSDLVRGIAHDPETLFTSVNVGYVEDLQMGTWVKNQAEKKDQPKEIQYVEDKSLIIDCEDAEIEKDKKTGANIATREQSRSHAEGD